jgi:hypothetical protein
MSKEFTMSLDEQLKLHTEDPKEYNNIWPHSYWTIAEYKELFEYIDKGWIIQGDAWDIKCNGFIVNPDWEGQPLWVKPTEACLCDEEEEKCWTCDVSVATHKTYRDALGEFELTCDKCHREEYPEEYEEEQKEEEENNE